MVIDFKTQERGDTPSSSIAAILPNQAVFFEMLGSHSGTLLDDERACLSQVAVEKRVREFTAGRHCARKALGRLGIPEVAILRGRSREPLWPAGVVGSITHCEGYCAAAVAKAADLAALGIDAEKNEPLPSGVENLVATEEEAGQFRQASTTGIHWDKLIFSAKESFFKAWFPVTQKWLEFKDVELRFDLERRAFRVHPGRSSAKGWNDSTGLFPQLARFEGKFLATFELLLTSAWLDCLER